VTTDLLTAFAPPVVAAIEALVDARVEAKLAEQARANAKQPTSEFMTIPEAAELLRCKRGRVDDLLSAGRIPRVKEGARTLIRRSDLDAYLNGGTRGTKGEQERNRLSDFAPPFGTKTAEAGPPPERGPA